MPGWHQALQPHLEAGKIRQFGILQEQHGDRARLFHQWQQMDFPLAVDAFNLLGVKVVPLHILIDGAGKIVSLRPNLAQVEALIAESEGKLYPAREAIAWQHEDWLEQALGSQASLPQLEKLRARTAGQPEDDRSWFRRGVLARMLYDATSDPRYFAEAVQAWQRGLALDPNQYIWRRRLQQYGPRLDKPYPFYSWIAQARSDIQERGQTPIQLSVEPRGAELAQPIRVGSELHAAEGAARKHPDPNDEITRDHRFVSVHPVVVVDTQGRSSARVHLELRLDPALRAHWNNEDTPPELWLDLPEQCVGPRSLVYSPPTREPLPTSSDETRRFEFELSWHPDQSDSEIPVTLFYAVCEGEDGTCLYRRQDFQISLPKQVPAAQDR